MAIARTLTCSPHSKTSCRQKGQIIPASVLKTTQKVPSNIFSFLDNKVFMQDKVTDKHRQTDGQIFMILNIQAKKNKEHSGRGD